MEEQEIELRPAKKIRVARQLNIGDTVKYVNEACLVMEVDKSDGLITVKMPDGDWMRDVEADQITVYGFDEREAIFSGGGWATIPMALTLLGKPAQEHLLAFLMNHHWHFGRKRRWFYVTTRTIIKHAYVSPGMVAFLMDKLERAGFIERRHKKGDRKRYLRIRYDVLHETLEQLKQQWADKYLT